MCLPKTTEEIGGILARKPSSGSFEEAAAAPVGELNALQLFEVAKTGPGKKVRIDGVGGSIGTVVVQLTRHICADVTAVHGTGKMRMLHEIGADHGVDDTHDGLGESGRMYDAAFDVLVKAPFPGHIPALNRDRRYLIA